MAIVLRTCQAIIFDECPMLHKNGFEALYRTLQDLRKNTKPMGNCLIILAGDFRQTLPVIVRSTPADEINACLKKSHLWKYVQTITLSTNMRVHLHSDEDSKLFATQLLKIGNGN